jgi:hypothetical protein
MRTPKLETVWFTKGTFAPSSEWIVKAYQDALQAPDGVFTEIIEGECADDEFEGEPCLFVAAVTVVGRTLGVFITEYEWEDEEYLVWGHPSNRMREAFMRAVARSTIGRDCIRES